MAEIGPRNILVTGASRGIGLGIAIALAAQGYRVLAVSRRSSEALEAAAAAAAPGAICFSSCDIGRLDTLPTMVNDLRKAHGPIYGLVNNAGLGTEGLLATMSIAEIEQLVRVNTIAPIVIAKHAARSMMSAGEGRIVNMSSIIASTGYNGLAVYGATKASMVGFTRSLARELGALGITVNAVAPGFIETELTASMNATQRAGIARRAALKRLPEVEDVAQAVVYLMSPAARNITGTVLTVDAGNTA